MEHDSPEIVRDIRKALIVDVNRAIERKVALLESPESKMEVITSTAKAILASIYATLYVNADPEVRDKKLNPKDFCDAFDATLLEMITDLDGKLRAGQLNDVIDAALERIGEKGHVWN